MSRVALVLVFLVFFDPRAARAEVERYALIIGNNQGHEQDPPLSFAESDAAKVFAVLRDLGGIPPLNMVLLEAEDAETVRGTLIALNDRVRVGQGRGTDAVLFVYYSGHADEAALHLGPTRLPLSELAQLVRGSSAKFRLLVVDACRSGVLTRLKGGTPRPPFPLPLESELTNEGLAFLTASAATEDAQESDELRGSFFTHAFVSGLLGAADRDQDGVVVLEEAYRHAYDTTVRDTSRTLHGAQHPAFAYDLRGQDALVLTRLHARTSERPMLTFPEGIDFMILRDDKQGAVVAELAARGTARTLSLRPGRYFIRGRGPKYLLEGTVVLSSSEEKTLDPSTLEQVEYARLVRKGEGIARRAHAIELGPVIHSRTAGASTPCWGLAGGYALELADLSVGLRLGVCRSELDHTWVSGLTREYDGSLSVVRPWDLPRVTLAAGIGAGALLAQQRFETRGRAPARLSTEWFVQLIASLTLDLTARTFARLDARTGTHFAKLQERASHPARLDVAFAVRAGLLVGMYLR